MDNKILYPFEINSIENIIMIKIGVKVIFFSLCVLYSFKAAYSQNNSKQENLAMAGVGVS